MSDAGKGSDGEGVVVLDVVVVAGVLTLVDEDVVDEVDVDVAVVVFVVDTGFVMIVLADVVAARDTAAASATVISLGFSSSSGKSDVRVAIYCINHIQFNKQTITLIYIYDVLVHATDISYHHHNLDIHRDAPVVMFESFLPCPFLPCLDMMEKRIQKMR